MDTDTPPRLDRYGNPLGTRYVVVFTDADGAPEEVVGPFDTVDAARDYNRRRSAGDIQPCHPPNP